MVIGPTLIKGLTSPLPRKGTLACLCDVNTRTSGASVRGNAAEKISVTHHFVIWSMEFFVSTRFHVAPSKGMLAFFFFFFSGSLGPHHDQTHPICPGRNHFSLMVFDVVGRSILGHWYQEKVC